MQTQDNTGTCYQRGTEEFGKKPLRRPPSSKWSIGKLVEIYE